jgi:hypothetical protein
MMNIKKRLLSIVLLIVLSLNVVGIDRPSTAFAESSQAGIPNAPNASFLPDDTVAYFDVRTSDLSKTLSLFTGLAQQITGSSPASLFANVNDEFSRYLGREFSIEKDILPWLGDRITMGLVATDQEIETLKNSTAKVNQSFTVFAMPNMIAIVNVKNDAAANEFLQQLINRTKVIGPDPKFTIRTDMAAGKTVTVYDQGNLCETTCYSILQMKGYLAAGLTTNINQMIETLKTPKPMFSSNQGFIKVMNSFKPNSLFTVFLAPRYYLYQFYQTLSTIRAYSSDTSYYSAQEDAIKAQMTWLDGQAFSGRIDGKALVVDYVQAHDLKALGEYYADAGLPSDLLQKAGPKPIRMYMVNQIPDKVLMAVVASNMGSLYDALQAYAKLAAQTSGGSDYYDDSLTQFERALKTGFSLDFRKDVLSWMTGEFAIYGTYNPNSSFSEVSYASTPYDLTMLIQTSNDVKTKTMMSRLNTGLEKVFKLSVETVTDNIYRVTMQDGLEIAYGLVGSTFFVTTGSGLEMTLDAIKGKSAVLSASPIWRNSLRTMARPTAQVWFMNMPQISLVVKALSETTYRENPETQQLLAAMDLLESVSISGGIIRSDGLVTGSFQAVLK